MLHCSTPPLVLLHGMGCPGQSLCVYTFTDFGNLMSPIRHFALLDTFQVSCDALHVHLVAVSRKKNLSCCFFYAVHDVSTLLAHVQALLQCCPVHGSFFVLQLDPVVGVLLTRGVATGLECSRQRTAITSRMYSGFASTKKYHDHSTKKENMIVQLSQSSHTAHHDLNRQMIK